MASYGPYTAVTFTVSYGGNQPVNRTVKLLLQGQTVRPVPYYGGPYTRKYGYGCSALSPTKTLGGTARVDDQKEI